MPQDKNNPGRPFVIVAIAVLTVFALQFVPWSKLTGGLIRDYNLFSDLFPETESKGAGNEIIDPALSEALAEHESPAQHAGYKVSEADTDTVVGKFYTDLNEEAPRVNGTVAIEDFTPGGTGLANLRRALNAGSARIAVIGDSYIEGDIFTQNIRAALQSRYGGTGVGYMPMHSELTGFRTSVHQKCQGWTAHDMRKTPGTARNTLQGEYCTATPGATTSFSGTRKLPNLNSWDKSAFMFIAPVDGNITLTTETGTRTFPVTASPDVQWIAADEKTSTVTFTTDISGLEVLGAYINSESGVKVDNMSMRGNSGASHRRLNTALAAQMRRFVDYDLIIVEYGINALSSAQDDYTAYGRLMTRVIACVRECYPHADILLMGIGDRGQKINGTVHSLPTAPAMIAAQRAAARQAGTLFWDTRAAMGGEDAVVSWRERSLVNPDYIHLNAKGGKALSDLFIESLNLSLQ